MGPGDETVHVDDVELAAVPRQPPATRHGEGLVAQQRRGQPRASGTACQCTRGCSRHTAATWLATSVTSQPAASRRRHDLVVHAALPVVAYPPLRDDGEDARGGIGRCRCGGGRRHGVAPPDAASMRA